MKHFNTLYLLKHMPIQYVLINLFVIYNIRLQDYK